MKISKMFCLLLLMGFSNVALATEYTCNGVKDTKGAEGTLSIKGKQLSFTWSDKNNSNLIASGTVAEQPEKGWLNVAPNPHLVACFDSFSITSDLVSMGQGFLSGYSTAGAGHPGDWTTYLFHCKTPTESNP